LFRAHWPLVVSYLRRRARDDSLAEELAAETFARATRAFLGWNGGSSAGWLLAIARNVHVDHLRRTRRVVPFDASLLDEGREAVPTVDNVERVLATLPTETARLLRLGYTDGFSYEEIAAMTGASLPAVRSALFRARQAFRDAWHRDENEGESGD
jgi:RNA polymerase sigma factor (sigma-70 family)